MENRVEKTRNGIFQFRFSIVTVEKMDEEECKQEQEDEHEALESMFMEDEFKIINPVGEKDPWFVFIFFFCKTFSLRRQTDRFHAASNFIWYRIQMRVRRIM